MNKFKTKNNRLIKLIFSLIMLFIISIIFFENLDINNILLNSLKNRFDNKIINTDKQELGAAFLSKAQVVDYIAGTQNKVLNRPCSALKYDKKGEDNCMDLCLLRKLIN